MLKNKFKWYMISVISGKEEKVISDIQKRIISEDLQKDFSDFKVFFVPYISPSEMVKKNKNQEYKIKQKNFFQGYIFIKLIMSNKSWFLIRNTQNVTGLIGSSGAGSKPIPISDKKFQKMDEEYQKTIKEKSAEDLHFYYFSNIRVGDMVQYSKNNLSYDAKIISIDNKNRTAIINYIYFGKIIDAEVELQKITKK